jgi:hypothetical protein
MAPGLRRIVTTMTLDLTTTNTFLGIMAAVSLLQAMAVLGFFLGGFLIYRRLMHVIGAIEAKHVAPAAARVNAILDDVKDVTATVKAETGRVDSVIHRIVDVCRFRRRGHDATRPM